MSVTFLSCGVVVTRLTEAGRRFLLLRVYRYWDFPKGTQEPGETPFATAKREVREETGLTQLDFPWGERFRETAPYRGGKVARYYLGQTDREEITLAVNPELGRPEHHEFRWVSAEQARALLGLRVRDILDWAVAIIEEAE